MQKNKKILIIDDISSIRYAIQEHLSDYYDTLEASSGKEALDICKSENIDLVLTDIRMPNISGTELIQKLKVHYPRMHYVLMTAFNIDNYIRFIQSEEIWNVVPKSVYLDLRYISAMIKKLLSPKLEFGIAPYFSNIPIVSISVEKLFSSLKKKNAATSCYKVSLGSLEETQLLLEEISKILNYKNISCDSMHVIQELVNNVREHSHTKGISSNDLLVFAPFDFSFCLLEKEEILIISVVDFAGSLDKREILSHLERQIITNVQTGLPIGITQDYGRGIYISREYCDQIIFNLHPHHKTEVIAIMPYNREFKNKAVSIYQQEPLA